MADLWSMIIETEKTKESSPELIVLPLLGMVAEQNLEANDKRLDPENAQSEKRTDEPVAQTNPISLPTPAIKVEKEDKASPETEEPEEASPEFVLPALSGTNAAIKLEIDDKSPEIENAPPEKRIDKPIAQADLFSLPTTPTKFEKFEKEDKSKIEDEDETCILAPKSLDRTAALKLEIGNKRLELEETNQKRKLREQIAQAVLISPPITPIEVEKAEKDKTEDEACSQLNIENKPEALIVPNHQKPKRGNAVKKKAISSIQCYPPSPTSD